MKKETQKLILDAMKDEFRAVHLPQPEEALRMQCEIVEGKSLTEFSAYEIGVTLGLWNQAESFFRKQPEPTEKERDRLLAQIRGRVRYAIRDATLDMGKEMPHRPGGRPAIPEERKQSAVLLVGTLMGCGDTYGEAIPKAATRFRLSSKTVQRAWQKAHRRPKNKT